MVVDVDDKTNRTTAVRGVDRAVAVLAEVKGNGGSMRGCGAVVVVPVAVVAVMVLLVLSECEQELERWQASSLSFSSSSKDATLRLGLILESVGRFFKALLVGVGVVGVVGRWW
jgi:hypothetical protein